MKTTSEQTLKSHLVIKELVKRRLYSICCLKFDPEFVSLPAVGPVTAGVVDVSREYGEMAYNISSLFLCFSFRSKAPL